MTKSKKDQISTKDDSQTPKIFGISKNKTGYNFSRRDFVKIAGAGLATSMISGCVPAAVATVEMTSTQTPNPPTSTTIPPTKTPKPTLTATPNIVTGRTITQGANIRTGPGTQYYTIGSLSANTDVIIIGSLADKTWYHVEIDISKFPALLNAPIAQNGSTSVVDGWIKATLLEILGGMIEDLPIDVPPATPTKLPNEKPTGDEGITYKYTDLYGNVTTYTLACGSPIPAGAICSCNCVSLCSCVGYVAPAPVNPPSGGNSICTCNMVTYWYPN